MAGSRLRQKLRAELETPPEQRRLGSGWLGGTLAFLLAAGCLVLMDWMAGARVHFLEVIVLRGVTAIPMFTLGFDPAAIQIYLLIVYFYSAFIHANIGWNLKPVEPLLATPRFHHWHHGEEREAIDVNFAIHFPLFDRLFGTRHMPETRWPKAYGIKGHPGSTGYWKQFLYPFQRRSAKSR